MKRTARAPVIKKVMRRTRAIVVAAKAPRAGAVKTRLCPPLSPEEAARLARAFLDDTLEAAAPLRKVADLFLALDEDAAKVPAAARRLRQRGGHLGERLVHLFADVFAEGYEQVCVVGSDAPHLPAAFLVEAFGRLAQNDVALGPADDGGYYLVALRAPAPELFGGDIGWGGPGVLADTLARAAEAGRTAGLLPPWYDIDTPHDLRRLQRDLRRGAAFAPATAALLQERPVREDLLP